MSAENRVRYGETGHQGADAHDIEKTVRILRDVPPYDLLTQAEASWLVGESKLWPVAAHETFVDDGEFIDSACILIDGHMKRYLVVEQGRRMLLNDTFAPAAFALAAPYARTPHVGRIEAVEPSTVLSVPIEAIDRLFERNPVFASGVVKRLAQSSARQTGVLLEFMYPVPVRLARFIVRIANNGVCDFGTTKADVAERLGTVPETLSRAIAALCGQGLIERDGPRFKIPDLRALREFAQLGL